MESTSNGSLSLRDALVLDVLAALVTHGIYMRYEIDPSRLFPTTLLLGVVPSLCAVFLRTYYGSVISALSVSFCIFYATLISSVILYRLSPVHPLARYPGPVLARVTKFYGLLKATSGKHHEWHKKLHEDYGAYVRVGPNELSVVDADAVSSILGSSGLPKGPMWDARRNPHGVPSLIAIRDVHEHSRRRKAWNRAFSITSVKGYEPSLARRSLQLVGELEKRAQTKNGSVSPAFDLTEWIRLFTFDFMGDMAFGGGFKTMRDGTDGVGIWHAIEGGIKTLAILQHVPWILRFLYLIPGTTNNVDTLRKNAEVAVRKRKQEGSHSKDLFHHLIDEDSTEKEAPTDAEVISDGVLAIVAGSDTTATVLSGLFYNLLLHPSDYGRLQEEVDQTFPLGEGGPLDASKLSGMVFLNAVINEALRISPPGNLVQRGTTSRTGAKCLGSKFIPEGTAVDVPLYTLFRDPRYFFPAPEEFWPDRWLDPSVRKRTPKQSAGFHTNVLGTEELNMSAFIPFSYGPANCAGRTLAMAELRMVVALLMQRFDMRLEEGYNPSDWNDKLEDWFIMKTGKLPVVLTVRN